MPKRCRNGLNPAGDFVAKPESAAGGLCHHNPSVPRRYNKPPNRSELARRKGVVRYERAPVLPHHDPVVSDARRPGRKVVLRDRRLAEPIHGLDRRVEELGQHQAVVQTAHPPHGGGSGLVTMTTP